MVSQGQPEAALGLSSQSLGSETIGGWKFGGREGGLYCKAQGRGCTGAGAVLVPPGLPVTSFKEVQTDTFHSCLGPESIPLMGWGV